MITIEIEIKAILRVNRQVPGKMKIFTFLATFILFEITLEAEITPNYDLADEEVKITPNYDFPYENIKIFEIGHDLTLVCNVSDIDSPIRWYKNLNESTTILIEANHHYELEDNTLRIPSSVSNDAGQYFCATSDDAMNASITVVANVRPEMDEEYYFVQTETLNISCVVDGTDPVVSWRIGNVSYDQSKDRVVIERGKGYGRLLINDTKISDANVYTCVVENLATKLLGVRSEVTTQIHIFQQYVLIWVYVGMVIEVAILCAAIFIYERRSKKSEEEFDNDPKIIEERTEYDTDSINVDVRER